MAINFPSNPTTGQVYEYQSIRWRWNGSAWDKYEVFTFNGLTANVEGVGSYNGLTGAVQGVSSWNGQTGTVNFYNYVSSYNGHTGAVTGVTQINAGTGIAITGTTNPTVTNTGVLSVNGSTGAVTNVARTNVDNNFTSSQTVTNGLNFTTYGVNEIHFYDDLAASEVFLYPSLSGVIQTVTLPGGANTTLAGLATTQTFTGINTFNTITTFNGGITASGITASDKVQAATYTETSNRIRVTNNARSWFL